MERISEKTRRGACKPNFQISVRLTEEEQKFWIWLKNNDVNMSDFTREVWKQTPEYKDFKNISQKEKKWLQEEIEKIQRRRRRRKNE